MNSETKLEPKKQISKRLFLLCSFFMVLLSFYFMQHKEIKEKIVKGIAKKELTEELLDFKSRHPTIDQKELKKLNKAERLELFRKDYLKRKEESEQKFIKFKGLEKKDQTEIIEAIYKELRQEAQQNSKKENKLLSRLGELGCSSQEFVLALFENQKKKNQLSDSQLLTILVKTELPSSTAKPLFLQCLKSKILRSYKKKELVIALIQRQERDRDIILAIIDLFTTLHSPEKTECVQFLKKLEEHHDIIIPAFIKFLKKEKHKVLSEIVIGLKEINKKPELVIPALIELLKKMEKHNSRKDIFLALGNFEEKALSAVPPMLLSLKEIIFPPDEVALIVALVKIKPDCLELLPLLFQIASKNPPFASQTGNRVLEKLYPIAKEPQKIQDFLIALLEEKDETKRNNAIHFLAATKPPPEKMFPLFQKMLNSPDEKVRNSLALAIRILKDEAYLPLLSKLLKDKETTVKIAAFTAFGQIVKGDEALISFIKKTINEKKDEETLLSVLTLTYPLKKVPDSFFLFLVNKLPDNSVSVQSRIIYVLNHFRFVTKEPAAIAILSQMLEHKENGVRYGTALFLARADKVNEKTIDVLIEIIKDDSSLSRMEKMLAVFKKLKGEEKRKALKELSLKKVNLSQKKAIETIGNIKQAVERVTPALISLFLDPRAGYLQIPIIETLGKIKARSAVPTLLSFIRKSSLLRSGLLEAISSALFEIVSFHQELLPDLLKELDSSNKDIRCCVASVLVKFPQTKERATLALFRLLETNSDRGSFRREILIADCVLEIDPKNEKAIRILMESCNKNLRYHGRDLRFLKLLVKYQVAPKKAIALLNKKLNIAPISSLRINVIKLLGQFKGKEQREEAIKILSDFLQKEPEEAVRNAAKEVLKTLKEK